MTRANLFIAVLALLPLGIDDKSHDYRFGASEEGKLPANWKAEHTGEGMGSVWKVEKDPTAPSGSGFALAQTAEGPDAFFNLCVAQDASYKDLDLSVSFKAVGGKEDRGGGMVWRYRDSNNYYICRMNPLENNFRVYRVVGGKRMVLQSKEDVKVPSNEWHSIKVSMVGDHIRCWLDDKQWLEAHDPTFTEQGKIGLWTKADAQTRFDSLIVKPR